jgi:hypothetical protein
MIFPQNDKSARQKVLSTNGNAEMRDNFINIFGAKQVGSSSVTLQARPGKLHTLWPRYLEIQCNVRAGGPADPVCLDYKLGRCGAPGVHNCGPYI